MRPLRVILVDDNREILEIASRALEHDFVVLRRFENGQSALEQEPELHPDIVVLDISLGNINGFEVAKKLLDNGSNAKVVLLSAHEEEDLIKAGFDSGAVAYVIKRRLESDLVPAVHAAGAGLTFVSSLL